MFPEGFRELVDERFRHIGAGEHDHFDGRGVDVGVLIRISALRNRVGSVPRIFCFQSIHQTVIDIEKLAAGGERLRNGGSGSAGHDPGAVDAAVLKHIRGVGEGDVFAFQIIGEFQTGGGEMRGAFVVDAGTGGSDSEVFALDFGEGMNAGGFRHDDLVRVQVKTADGAEIFERLILKAVGSIQSLKAVAADGNGDLRFAVGDHAKIRDAACRGLTGGAHAGNVLVPHIRNGGAYGVKGPRCGSGRKVNFYRLPRRWTFRRLRFFFAAAARDCTSDGQRC